MKILKKIDEGFSALRTRDQVIAFATVAILLVLAVNLVLLKPQALQIDMARQAEASHRKELATLKDRLDALRAIQASGVDPFAEEHALIAQYQSRIKEVEALMPKEDGGSVSSIGVLVRGMTRQNRGLSLVSLRTLKGEVFYAPPQKKADDSSYMSKDMKAILDKTKASLQAPPEVVIVNKTLYRHGIEVVVKGSYPDLIAYMRELLAYSKNVFWSEATVDAKDHRQVSLKLLLYSLSDQQQPSLR